MACVDCNCGRANVCEQFEPEINDDKVVAEAELRSFVDAHKAGPKVVWEVAAPGGSSGPDTWRHDVTRTALTIEAAEALRSELEAVGYTDVTVTSVEQKLPEEVSRLLSALSTYFS